MYAGDIARTLNLSAVDGLLVAAPSRITLAS